MKAYGMGGHHPLDHTNGVGDLRSCPVASRFEHGEGGLIPPSYKAMNEYVPVSTTDGEEEEKERGGEEGRVAAAASAVGGGGGDRKDRKDLARRQLARLVFDDIDEDGDNQLETWELRDLLGEERERCEYEYVTTNWNWYYYAVEKTSHIRVYVAMRGSDRMVRVQPAIVMFFVQCKYTLSRSLSLSFSPYVSVLAFTPGRGSPGHAPV